MKENSSSMNAHGSLNYIVRTAKQTDISGVVDLIYKVCEAEGDTANAVTKDELRNEWAYEGFDPEKDAFVAEDAHETLVGYAAVYDVDRHCELSGDIYLHPDADVRMVAEALLQAMQTRSREHIALAAQNEEVFIRVALDNRNALIKSVFLDAGFTAIRYHWRMEIELQQPPFVPEMPEQLALKPFDWQNHAQAVWQARNAAFVGNWGSRELSFEEFTYYTKEHPEYDPGIWQVAWQGDRVVGFCINHMRMGIGWVHILGVVPQWRGKGLGEALLKQTFLQFYQRGTKVIGLGVDTENVSGATRLYKRAGMNTVSEFVTFEKRFR